MTDHGAQDASYLVIGCVWGNREAAGGWGGEVGWGGGARVPTRESRHTGLTHLEKEGDLVTMGKG